jgi:hypothetical protein
MAVERFESCRSDHFPTKAFHPKRLNAIGSMGGAQFDYKSVMGLYFGTSIFMTAQATR